jgi:perosamine synthetase
MKNGQMVAEFERAFAEYVGAKYAIALCNGTATLHTALVALGVKPGDKVAVPPLTMSATTIAVLHAGAVPVFVDVDPETWLMDGAGADDTRAAIGVSLYGLQFACFVRPPLLGGPRLIDDAAQTLRKHDRGFAFTSYSFQASKILALGEGGMLVTNDEELASKAREFSSLGYRMRADQPRIDPDAIKSPTFDRHYSLGWNYRMNDLTAREGLLWLMPQEVRGVDWLKQQRQEAASRYREAIAGCSWVTPQHVPDGWTHDAWTYAVACDTPERAIALADAAVKNGGERPFPAWKLTYQEPAFEHLARQREPIYLEEHIIGRFVVGYLEHNHPCPVAESLQPRLLQFQTNRLASAERNATALRKAIEDLS